MLVDFLHDRIVRNQFTFLRPKCILYLNESVFPNWGVLENFNVFMIGEDERVAGFDTVERLAMIWVEGPPPLDGNPWMTEWQP